MKTSLTQLILLSSLVLSPLAQAGNQNADGPAKRNPERMRRMEQRGENRGAGGQAPVERYLHQLKKTDPEEYQRMKALKESDPAAFRQELRQKAMSRRREMAQKHTRHFFKEEMKAIRQAETPEAREEAVAALRVKVAEQVDRNLQRREERMAQVREQLSELESRHKLETEQKEQLIDRHVEKLLEKLEQGAPAAND